MCLSLGLEGHAVDERQSIQNWLSVTVIHQGAFTVCSQLLLTWALNLGATSPGSLPTLWALCSLKTATLKGNTGLSCPGPINKGPIRNISRNWKKKRHFHPNELFSQSCVILTLGRKKDFYWQHLWNITQGKQSTVLHLLNILDDFLALTWENKKYLQ